MEELLLPNVEEEVCSDNSSYAPGNAGRTMGDQIKTFLLKTVKGDLRTVKNFFKRNGLLTLSVISIYFSFPGELLMRMLKMLILPLITSRWVNSKACCRMGVLTVTYYLWTTFIAVVVGILLVIVIKPGVGTEMESNRLGGGPVMTSADALLDLIRNMVPSNLIEATFQQVRQQNLFMCAAGLLLGRMGERGVPLINVCQCINECVMKIINAAVWYFPFGIIFLVAGKILDMQDPSTLGKKLGWYGVTVLTGLFVHGLVLLPLFYFLLTRKNPFSYIRGLLQAMVIALATSSSSATLPITMKCLLENCHVDRQIARFVLPVGATINMDGTALYEAVAAIFIAQVNDYELDFGQLVTISITATAASIGAAGIPQAGLVTMVIVLTSVGLPPDDITLIVAIDWILDRFRTMINVLGDALAAGIIAHLCRKDFPLSTAGKPVPSYGTQTPHKNSNTVNVPMTEMHTHKDCTFDLTGDSVSQMNTHTVYYNICQV
ncbi:dedicator of cytokinesis protein 9/10/11 [Sarotherodon galilaeus]